jgi:hypothetical protein
MTEYRAIGRIRRFHRMVKLGIYPENWAGDVLNGGADFGERRSAR